MFDAWKLRRIERAYERIDKLERSLSVTDDVTAGYPHGEDLNFEVLERVAELRREFASESVVRVARGLANVGVSKPERKAFLRRLVKGNL